MSCEQIRPKLSNLNFAFLCVFARIFCRTFGTLIYFKTFLCRHSALRAPYLPGNYRSYGADFKIPQFLSSSVPQFLNSSIPQFLNPSIPQSLSSSIPQFLNSSVPQFLNFGVIPKNTSKLIPGIGRDKTERYSSLKRLLTAPLIEKSAHLHETVFSKEILLMKY